LKALIRWPGRDSREPGFDWAPHELRAGPLVTDLRSLTQQGYLYRREGHELRANWLERLRQLSPEGRTSLLLLFIRHGAGENGRAGDTDWGLRRIDPRDCVVTDDEATCALRTAVTMTDTYAAGVVLTKALSMAVQARPGTGEGLRSAIQRVANSLGSRTQLAASDQARLRRQLLALTQPLDQSGGVVDTSVILPGDGWAAAVLPELAAWGDAASVNTLLRHLLAASGSKPSKAWLTRSAELLRDAGAARVVRCLLAALTTAHGVDRQSYGMTYNVLLSIGNADVTRSAAWVAGLLDEPWVVPTLRAVAYQGIHTTGRADYIESPKPANACIYSLGVIASADAIAALQNLQRTTKHHGFRKQIAAALVDAAQRAGLTPGQLVERAVPVAGLDANSERRLDLTASATARVRITLDCRVVTEWRHPGGWLPKAPAGVDPKQHPELRAAVKEVKDGLAGERARLESLLADDRRWDVAQWRDLYLAHPVTGPLARRLLWTVEGDVAETGLPSADGKLATLDGEREVPPAATVRLWHPARAGTAQVQGWRDRLVREELAQPFKQAFREVYLLTPAERETRLYSNRYAAHILHYRQVYALMKTRTWVANYLGPYDGGYEGNARRDFADAGLTAVFAHYPADAGPNAQEVELCSTDRVVFHRTADRAHRPVPLEEVPDLVFTEAMRDVDLFVGVASITLDPTWIDRGGAARHIDYWSAFSFGELSETAKTRRDALGRIVPKLKIATRLELGDRFLRVRGRLNTYKIHLGSANIQIEPDDRYLCIVPGGGGARSVKVMLPFEGDQVLSVILSKAVLLAADDKITDPTILQQLRHRLRLDGAGGEVTRHVPGGGIGVVRGFLEVREGEARHQLAADLRGERVAVLDRPGPVRAETLGFREVQGAERELVAHNEVILLVQRRDVEDEEVRVQEPGHQDPARAQHPERLPPDGGEIGAEHVRHRVEDDIEAGVRELGQVAHVAEHGADGQSLAIGDLAVAAQLPG
jgi:hypothetical protein